MKRWLLTIGLFLGLCMAVAAQDTEATAKVQNEQVMVGKPFALDLSLKAPKGSNVEWNAFPADTLSKQIEILSRGNLQRTIDADSNIIMQQQLTLMTFDTGDIQIPSLQLSTLNSQFSTLTDPVQLHATTITVDTTQTFRPIVGPIRHPMSKEKIFYWVLAALLLILVGLVVWYLWKHRKPKTDKEGKPVQRRKVPPYDKAIGALGLLRVQGLWQQGRTKEYYSGLSDITREYIEGQFQVNAVEMTTDEILREIEKLKFDTQIYCKIKDAMELSDLVKFAKYAPSQFENDRAMDNVEGFVKESYQHYQALKAKEEEEARRHV